MIGLTLKSFRKNKTRTLLCLLSAAIGSFAVVFVLLLSSICSKNVEIEMRKSGIDGLLLMREDENLVSTAVFETVRRTPGINGVSGVIMGSSKVEELLNSECVSWGIDNNAKEIIALEAIKGRFFTDYELAGYKRVCLVDEQMAKALSGDGELIGSSRAFLFGGEYIDFLIVGIVRTGGGLLQNFTAFLPQMAFFPINTLSAITGCKGYTQIAIRTDSGINSETVKNELSLRLFNRKDGIIIQNLAKQKESLSSIVKIISLLLIGAGGACVLVASIGITSVMVMSVNERTSEIGIKKALGAGKYTILSEFILESVTISSIGTFFGTAVALLFIEIGTRIIGIESGFSLSFFAIIMIASIVLGIIVGGYPAYKAASLQPKDALSR